jgi:hypothetical protein
MALNVGSIIGFVGADNSAYLKAVDESIRAGEKMAKAMERQFKAVGKSMQDLGRTMSIAVTAPIVAATGAMAKAAVDANETRNKFNVVFRDIAKDANMMAEELKNAYGLGATESRKLLGDTGDLLTGFGFTQKAALDLSTRVNKLAVDLASFTNIEGGSARASQALTKAILGETEQAKALGIVIRQDSKEFKSLVEEQMNSHGMSLLQAKALAALTIATNQSKNAIGDYARTAGETANQQRLFWTRVKDSAEAIGQRLIPALDRALAMGFRLLNMWNSLSISQQDQILQYTLLAAAIGPALLVFGGLLKVAGTLFGVLGTGLGVLAKLTTGFLTFAPVVVAVALGVALLLDAFGALPPSSESVGKAFVWLQGIWKETADFWGGVVGNILDNTETLTEGQRTAVEFIAKVWLGLKFAWNAVVVGLQSIIQTITIALDGLLFNMERLSRFAKMKGLADSIGGVRSQLQKFVVDVEDAKEANFKTMKEIADSWDEAPKMLREDISVFKETVTELGAQALEGIKGLAPEAVEKIQGLIAQINSALAAGEAGAVNIPVTYGTEQFGPAEKPIGAAPFTEISGLAFLRQRDEAIQTANNLLLRREFETLAALAENDRAFHEENLSAWEMWKNSQIDTMNNWKTSALSIASSIKTGFADNLAAVIVSGKSFSKGMISLFQTTGQRLIAMAIENAMTRIAISFAVTKAKGVESAPHPFLIPAFVGLAVAGFSAAMSGTMFGGGSGSGGASAAISEPTIQEAQVSRIEALTPAIARPADDVEEFEGSGRSTLRLAVIENEFGSEFMRFAVTEAKNGKGDGVDTLVTTRDIG